MGRNLFSYSKRSRFWLQKSRWTNCAKERLQEQDFYSEAGWKSQRESEVLKYYPYSGYIEGSWRSNLKHWLDFSRPSKNMNVQYKTFIHICRPFNKVLIKNMFQQGRVCYLYCRRVVDYLLRQKTKVPNLSQSIDTFRLLFPKHQSFSLLPHALPYSNQFSLILLHLVVLRFHYSAESGTVSKVSRAIHGYDLLGVVWTQAEQVKKKKCWRKHFKSR